MASGHGIHQSLQGRQQSGIVFGQRLSPATCRTNPRAHFGARMRSTGFQLARPTHDRVPRQAGRQGHGSDTSPTQIIGFARGPLSAHPLIHQSRQRPVLIPYPLDDGFVLREGMFLHLATAGNTYLLMLLFRGALVSFSRELLEMEPPAQAKALAKLRRLEESLLTPLDNVRAPP